MGELVIYSGRNRPDLTPVYELYRQLTGTTVRVEKIYHQDVGERVLAERDAPGADLLLTNSQLAMEALRESGVFDPYRASVAEGYPSWLRAPDFSWLSFTAWPRVIMVSRIKLGEDSANWPTSLHDLCDPRFRGAVACASLVEMTTVAQFAALRVARGDPYVDDLLDQLVANDIRVYTSNKDTREALARDGLSLALANSSNVHVFYLEGNAVGEAWPDQDGTGTHVEAHTVAVLRGAQHREEGQRFIDFLLSVEIQTFLARIYGETPVNAAAEHGSVRPLSAIHRLDAAIGDELRLIDSTVQMLRERGFETRG